MADSETQKLIHEAESALHRASEAVEDTLAGTKASLRKADKKLTQEAGVLQGGLERVLGGKSLFWVEEPVDGRRLANNMVGWGAFGLAVHAWHRGIQRVPVLSPPYRPFLLAFPIWSLLGYYIHHFELGQEEVIAHRRLLLKRNRGLLEEKDYQEMSLSQGFKERLERKSKHLGLSSSPDSVFPVPKTFNTEGREVVDHPVKAKVLTMVAKGHSDMEGYGKRLHDKLEQFEREFSEQDHSAYAKALEARKLASPYMSAFPPTTHSPGRVTRPTLPSPSTPSTTPEPAISKQEEGPLKPRSGGGWGSYFGLGASSSEQDSGVVGEVEKALR